MNYSKITKTNYSQLKIIYCPPIYKKKFDISYKTYHVVEALDLKGARMLCYNKLVSIEMCICT